MKTDGWPARLGWILLFAGLLVTQAATAQDPRASAAQLAARAFLELSDRDEGNASWQAAGKQFQGAITAARWSEALHEVRAPLGPVAERTLTSTEFTKKFPDVAREGEYAVLVFRTSFANRADAGETLTVELEPDGVWRVVGYFLR